MPPFSVVPPVQSPAVMTPTTRVINQDVLRASERDTEMLQDKPSRVPERPRGNTACGRPGACGECEGGCEVQACRWQDFNLADGVAGTPGGLGATIQVEAPTPISPTDPFIPETAALGLGALSPVISSRTMQIHHGCHHAQCIELANRLSRGHDELAGMSPLEVVRWAREHSAAQNCMQPPRTPRNHALFSSRA